MNHSLMLSKIFQKYSKLESKRISAKYNFNFEENHPSSNKPSINKKAHFVWEPISNPSSYLIQRRKHETRISEKPKIKRPIRKKKCKKIIAKKNASK